MRYLPKSPSERQEMLDAIGVRSVEELFRSIPEAFRLKRPLNLPGPLSEAELIRYFRERAAENSLGYTSFLGAGVYNHLRSVVTDTIIQRGEFLTSYTPYQAEISQGTLQAIFEFQTLMCELTGQEVANASMWDGSTATTEAVLMAERLTRTPARAGGAVAASGIPRRFWRPTRATWGWRSTKSALRRRARSIRQRWPPRSMHETAAVVVQSPNFFGVIEPVAQIAELAHAGKRWPSWPSPKAFRSGVVRPPAEADIVAMEAQSFGLAPSYGGPYAGVIATREKYVRQMPGRLAGQTTDAQGRRGFCLTLATREQHIRREKATSNICTNQALCALAATVHLCLLGKEGLREMAEQNLAKAQFALAKLEKIPGVRRALHRTRVQRIRHSAAALGAPGERRIAARENHRAAAARPFYPDLTKCGLVCVTETTSRAEIERLAAAVQRILAATGQEES